MEEYFPPENADPKASDTKAAPAAKAGGDLAVKRSVLRVLVFAILSGGLYSFYWFYVTRKRATEELGTNDQVGLQTLGLIVPILNFFIIYWLFRDIDKLQKNAGLAGFPALWFVVGPIILSFIPFVNFIAGIVWLVIYGLVISKYNEYWDKKSNGQATDAKVTTNEVLVVVGGIVIQVLFWILIGAAMIFGASKANDINTDLNNSINDYNTSTQNNSGY